MKELLFLINEAEEGGYYAEAVGAGIFAEGETVEELKKSIKSGIECYYENSMGGWISPAIYLLD
jgi:predicted RNase H-like HicB family nuclease